MTRLIDQLTSAVNGSAHLNALLAQRHLPAAWKAARERAAMPSGASEEVMDRDAPQYLADYTGDISAAFGFVQASLDGWRFGVERHAHAERGWNAFVQIRWGPNAERRWTATARTPALALCAAAVEGAESGAT